MSDTERRKNRIYVIISIIILLLSAALTASVYWIPLRRLCASIVDFGRSFAHFCIFAFEDSIRAFGKEPPQIRVTAAELPDFTIYWDYLGINIAQIFESFESYWDKVFDAFNFVYFNITLVNRLLMLFLYGEMLIPLGYIMITTVKDSYLEDKPDSLGEKSKAYNRFISVAVKLKGAVYRVKEYILYFYEKKYFFVPFVALWLVNFAVLTVAVDFLSWYFYFATAFDLMSFLYFLARFGIDILIILHAVPFIVLLLVFAVCYYLYYRNKAFDTLRHNEAKNCGLLKELEYIILIIGETGKGKTTLMTDMVLSFVNIYKTDTLKTMYKIELYFPGFDFASFRAFLIPKIVDREIFCVPQIDDAVNMMFDEYEISADPSALYGYELDLYGDTVNLGNRTLGLREALITYGRAFLVYQNNNPTVSNYSIRFNGQFDDSPFLKLWDGDFFRTEGESYYAHVLDSDIERFGKKVDPNGKFNGSFGWGIWVRTEAAKSYGNQISNAEYDRKSDEANPLNDLVEYSAKMGRHPNAMIDHNVYFRKFMDEQRPTDLAGKLRELCSIITIDEKGELQLAIQGFDWLFALRNKLDSFERFYLKYQNKRADFTVALILPKMFVSTVRLCCERLENVYGYRELTLIKEGGTAYSGGDGVKKEPKTLTWYQSNMKVYAERFASDCYSSFFTDMQKRCGYGIEDYPEYAGLNPTMEEYEMQKDFFLQKMMMKTVYGYDPDEEKVKTKKSANEDKFAGLIFEE